MAHYALIRDSLVVNVFVGRDESDTSTGIDDWETYYAPPGMIVKRTSYNTHGGIHYSNGFDENGYKIPSADQSKAFRFNYAAKGMTYDETRDAFIPPQPFDSWILNEDTCLWEAPIPYPGDGLAYSWDETAGDWIEIQQ